jgi:hypothetical protein
MHRERANLFGHNTSATVCDYGWARLSFTCTAVNQKNGSPVEVNTRFRCDESRRPHSKRSTTAKPKRKPYDAHDI